MGRPITSSSANGSDGAAAALRAGLARFAGWDGSTHQLLAMIAAFAVTGLSLDLHQRRRLSGDGRSSHDHLSSTPSAPSRQTILFALCKLNEIQFDAPWAPRRGRCSGL